MQSKNTQMKNIRYEPVKEKEIQARPVDNATLVVLWILAWMHEQPNRKLRMSNSMRDNLPVIAF